MMNKAVGGKWLDIQFRDDQHQQLLTAPQQGLEISRKHVNRMEGHQVSMGLKQQELLHNPLHI